MVPYSTSIAKVPNNNDVDSSFSKCESALHSPPPMATTNSPLLEGYSNMYQKSIDYFGSVPNNQHPHSVQPLPKTVENNLNGNFHASTGKHIESNLHQNSNQYYSKYEFNPKPDMDPEPVLKQHDQASSNSSEIFYQLKLNPFYQEKNLVNRSRSESQLSCPNLTFNEKKTDFVKSNGECVFKENGMLIHLSFSVFVFIFSLIKIWWNNAVMVLIGWIYCIYVFFFLLTKPINQTNMTLTLAFRPSDSFHLDIQTVAPLVTLFYSCLLYFNYIYIYIYIYIWFVYWISSLYLFADSNGYLSSDEEENLPKKAIYSVDHDQDLNEDSNSDASFVCGKSDSESNTHRLPSAVRPSLSLYNFIEELRVQELTIACDMLSHWCQYRKIVTELKKIEEMFEAVEIIVKKVIQMARMVTTFKELCEMEQIALLKGSVTEMIILRSVLNFVPEEDSWLFNLTDANAVSRNKQN